MALVAQRIEYGASTSRVWVRFLPGAPNKRRYKMEFILGAIVGLVLGWAVIPQPQWAKDLIARIIG